MGENIYEIVDEVDVSFFFLCKNSFQYVYFWYCKVDITLTLINMPNKFHDLLIKSLLIVSSVKYLAIHFPAYFKSIYDLNMFDISRFLVLSCFWILLQNDFYWKLDMNLFLRYYFSPVFGRDSWLVFFFIIISIISTYIFK